MILGDVMGRPARRAVRDLVPALIEKEEIDLAIANAENAAGGTGVVVLHEFADSNVAKGVGAIRLHEKSPVIAEDFRLDEQDAGQAGFADVQGGG